MALVDLQFLIKHVVLGEVSIRLKLQCINQDSLEFRYATCSTFSDADRNKSSIISKHNIIYEQRRSSFFIPIGFAS
jgi:hypothetical protein